MGPFEERQKHGVAHDDGTNEDGEYGAAVHRGLEIN
jgi:hypothetical protein